MPESTRVAAKIGPWIDAAIERHAQGDEVAWEISLALAPDGMPVCLVALWMQSGVMGVAIPLVMTIGNPMALDEAGFVEAVSGSLEQIRQRRSTYLAQQAQLAQAQADSQNGHHQQPPQGLVLPGSLPPV